MYFCSYTGAAVQGSWLVMVALTHKSIWSVLSWSVTFTLYGLRVCARMMLLLGRETVHKRSIQSMMLKEPTLFCNGLGSIINEIAQVAH